MSGRNPTYTNPEPCKHLADYKLKHGLSGYNSLQKSLNTNPNGRTAMNRSQSKIPRCSFCSGYQGRLYFCLICSSVSCCNLPDSNHAHLHSQTEIGHEIAVDMERAELFCSVCCDQVYDPDFDKAVMFKQMIEIPRNNNGGEVDKVNCNKRRKVMSKAVRDYMNSKDLVLKLGRGPNSCFPWGLRGLSNLGNTCFMNSVLQALLHAPPLRNYFLTDRHRCRTSRKSSLDKPCLRCDIIDIFSAVYSGDPMPFSPARFLYSWWRQSPNLASYEQQDAHEFFMSVLDQIHEKEEQNRSSHKDNSDCHCIAHKVFSGVLRSDVACTTCGFTSTTYDPCLDISLDLDPSDGSTKTGPGKATNPIEDEDISTLVGCLDLFTRPEKLDSDLKLYCQQCQVRTDSVKQMSIRRLPLVLCFHIKRFEVSPLKKMCKKIDRYLQFPFTLDMTPYLSSSIVRNRFGNRIFAFEGDESDISTEFEVFAVVTHFGKLESGHYVTYLRLRNQWYKCDDAWITQVSDRVVRASQGYLIYYIQKMP